MRFIAKYGKYLVDEIAHSIKMHSLINDLVKRSIKEDHKNEI